ncbi:acyltransferase [soil metagenome]
MPSRYPVEMSALTSLRFFAAAWVVLTHFAPEKSHWPVIAQGNLAVDFFFVLSGFVLAHAYLSQVRDRRLDVRQFLVRRFGRLYPLHLVTLLFYVVLVATAALIKLPLPNPERYTGGQLVLNLLLIHGWQVRDAGAWNYPSWSISAEWFAYLMFPLLVTGVLRLQVRMPVRALLAMSLTLLAIFWVLAMPLFGVHFLALHSNFSWWRIVPEFTLGIVLYQVGTHSRLPILELRHAVGVLAVAVAVLSASEQLLSAAMALAALIYAAAESARQGTQRFLVARPLVYLGEISYSLYMVHAPVGTLCSRGWQFLFHTTPDWLLVPAFLATVLVAAAAHRWIEIPGRALVLKIDQLLRSRIEPRPA